MDEVDDPSVFVHGSDLRSQQRMRCGDSDQRASQQRLVDGCVDAFDEGGVGVDPIVRQLTLFEIHLSAGEEPT